MHNIFKLLIHLREWEETQRTSEKLYGFNEYLSCRWNVQYPLQVATVNCNFNINLMPLFSISFIICRHNYYKLLRPQMITRKMTHSDDSLTSRLSLQLKKNQAFVILFDYLFFFATLIFSRLNNLTSVAGSFYFCIINGLTLTIFHAEFLSVQIACLFPCLHLLPHHDQLLSPKTCFGGVQMLLVAFASFSLAWRYDSGCQRTYSLRLYAGQDLEEERHES